MGKNRLLLAVIGISLIFLVGCQLPFTTKARVKNYLSQVEPVFNRDREQVNSQGKRLNLDKIDQKTVKANLQVVEEMEGQIKANKKEMEAVSVPKACQELRSKLDHYYQIEAEDINLIAGLYQYLDNTVSYWNKPDQYSDQFSQLDTSSMTKLAQGLDQMAESVGSDIKELKKIEPNKLSKKIHRELLARFSALKNLLTDLAQAVRAQNPSQITQASNQFDQLIDQSDKILNNLQLSKEMEKSMKEYGRAEEEVLSEINRLKVEYKIDQ